MQTSYRSSVLAAVIVYLLTCSIVSNAKSPSFSASPELFFSFEGKIEEDMGTPVAGAYVEVSSNETRVLLASSYSDSKGQYKLSGIPKSESFRIVVTAQYCNKVIRKIPNSSQLQEKPIMNFTLTCSDPPEPMLPHVARPNAKPTDYAGHYQIVTITQNAICEEGCIILSTDTASIDSNCKCFKGWHLAISESRKGCLFYGCWQINENGDIKLSFPCAGVAFAGSKDILWLEGQYLIGQGSSWSDTGHSSSWRIVAAKIK